MRKGVERMKSITKTIMIAASAFALCFGLTACDGAGANSKRKHRIKR